MPTHSRLRIPTYLLLTLLGAGAAAAAIDTLDMRTCVRTALAHNLQIDKSRASTAAGTAALMNARSRLLPGIALQANSSRSYSEAASGTGITTSNSVSIGAQQTIFAFGKNLALYRAAAMQSDAAGIDESGIRQDIILQSQTAYLGCLLAQETLKLNETARAQTLAHLASAQAQFDAGTLAKYAVTKARVDTANAAVNCIKARHSLLLARLQLENTLGTNFADTVFFADSLSQDLSASAESDTLTKGRSDIRAAELRLEAAQQQVLSARRSCLPSVTGNASTGYRSSTASDWKSNWSLGAGITAPLFEGGANLAGIRSAEAQERIQQASLNILQQTADKEIRQYRYDIRDAEQRLDATALLIEQATEGLAVSSEKFAQGSASSIEITDAETTHALARISRAQAEYDYRIAGIRLLRARGALSE